MENLKLTLKKNSLDKTIIQAGTLSIGSDLIMIAGPCAVENEAQMFKAAEAVYAAGANMLRGGAYKPRSSPYSFQGLGLEGLKLLKSAGEAFSLPIVTEVLDPRDVDWVAEYADVLQIGTRNMQNYALLKEVGRVNKPVVLKRGMYSTLEEWLGCAEYILSEGNSQVILCERGIRTFGSHTRNTLDLGIIPVLKELTHLPVIVDPSHATGKSALVTPLCLAALACGADGLLVEVHPDPKNAWSDREQQLNPTEFKLLMAKISKLKECLI